jgi:hypothetical protein
MITALCHVAENPLFPKAECGVMCYAVICCCRVKSTEIALEKAAAEVKGSVLASDAFFPFSWGDSVEMACKVGGTTVAVSKC